MKKRIVCLLLSLFLLVGLLPVTAMSATAATFTTTEKAITIIKNLQGFKKSCDENGYIGYGTKCTEKGTHGVGLKHTISQSDADAAFRKVLPDYEKAVTEFASKNKVALNQNKFDALVLVSFISGQSWMNGTGELRAAVINGLKGNEFLNAICRGSYGSMNMKMVAANMYLSGKYSSIKPSNYVKISFDPNGGKMPNELKDYYYDINLGTTALPTPIIYDGTTFMGWYIGGTTRIFEMSASTVTTMREESGEEPVLIAKWQDGNNNNTVNYYYSASKLSSTSVYEEDLKTKSNPQPKLPSTLHISLERLKDGYIWGYSQDIGWLRLSKSGVASGTAKDDVNATMDLTVSVTNSYVNCRANASAGSAKIGSFNQGDQLRIINTESVLGALWGQVAKSATDITPIGWVALMYTNYDAVKNGTTIAPPVNNGKVIATAKIDINGYVNLRSGAGVNHGIVGSVAHDEQVDIYETKYVSGQQWGRCDRGWLCLAYANVTRLEEEKNETSDIGFTAYTFNIKVNNDSEIYWIPEGSSPRTDTYGISSAVLSRFVRKGNITWGNIGKDKWIQVSDQSGSMINAELAEKAIFTVSSSSATVRNDPSAGSSRLDTIYKGTEVQISKLVANEDTLWGWAENVSMKDDVEISGWVNLSNKYFSRQGAPVSSDGKKDETPEARESGKGIIANTYSGVNVRQGPGTNYNAVGKILNGTPVEIIETKAVGQTKWGRVTQGWICMDYVTMISYEDIPDGATGSGSQGGTSGSTSTTTGSEVAIYTGYTITSDVHVYKSPSMNAMDAGQEIRTLPEGSPVTVHELLEVTEVIADGDEEDSETGTTQTAYTKYWARINDGYIIDPGLYIELNALDEAVFTNTDYDRVDVKTEVGGSTTDFSLTKNEQVNITKLEIHNGKVWGQVEHQNGREGWVQLSKLTKGAVAPKQDTPAATTPTQPTLGSTGNTGTGGFTTNKNGSIYTGKIINSDAVNVRATASTNAKITTQVKRDAAINVYETTISENMAWGRCDAGWIYLYYVDLTPTGGSSAVDARVVFNDNSLVYATADGGEVTGSYARMSVVDIYEVIGKMARTDLGWVNTDNLLQ